MKNHFFCVSPDRQAIHLAAQAAVRILFADPRVDRGGDIRPAVLHPISANLGYRDGRGAPGDVQLEWTAEDSAALASALAEEHSDSVQ
jgi:hypothetical protein